MSYSKYRLRDFNDNLFCYLQLVVFDLAKRVFLVTRC